MKIKIAVNNQIVNLRDVAGDAVDTIFTAAMEAPAKQMQAMIRMVVPKETGALSQSIDYVVRTYAKRGVVACIVGPKKNYRFNGRRPSKYAHLVEFGHVAVAPRKGKTIRKGTARKISFVAPRPFMRVAVQAARSYVASGLATGIQQNLNIRLRYARKGK